MQKIMIFSFLLSIQITHSVQCMDGAAIRTIEATLEHGRKQELLKIVKKNKVRFIGYHKDAESLIKEKAEHIIQSLASLDSALTINDANPNDPTLIVDISKIVPFPLLQNPHRPSLWQSLGVPLVKGSLLIAAGYLLHKWTNGQGN